MALVDRDGTVLEVGGEATAFETAQRRIGRELHDVRPPWVAQGVNLNLGCGLRPIANALNIDRSPAPTVDLLADILHLPFRDSSIDVVFARGVLEHIMDLPAALSEIRVLRPSGRLVAMVPYDRKGRAHSLHNPWHFRVFGVDTLKHMADPSTDLDRNACTWRYVRHHIDRFTHQWHLLKHLGLRLKVSPIPPEMRFVMEAVKRPPRKRATLK
jgi:SAM-dependent methyltransferase